MISRIIAVCIGYQTYNICSLFKVDESKSLVNSVPEIRQSFIDKSGIVIGSCRLKSIDQIRIVLGRAPEDIILFIPDDCLVCSQYIHLAGSIPETIFAPVPI